MQETLRLLIANIYPKVQKQDKLAEARFLVVASSLIVCVLVVFLGFSDPLGL
jgi:hypothetical protein